MIEFKKYNNDRSRAGHFYIYGNFMSEDGNSYKEINVNFKHETE